MLVATASQAQAQRFVYRNTYVVPTPYAGNFRNTTTYTAPYNYGSVSTGIYSTPFGYNAYYSTTTAIQPVYSGPYHSIIWDPTTLTYRYVGGTANTPSYSYTIPNPYLPY
jgi:hypothetical protein